ncbi:MAG: SirB2 family protein [Pseudomonadota bacterium]
MARALYYSIKILHQVLATISIVGFVLRGIWMLRRSPLLIHPVTRIAPHVVDTVFLATGITLAIILQQLPGPQPWLVAKIVGLVAYVVAGSMALKRARHYRQRAVWFVVALVCFGYIVSVALTRNVLGFLSLLGPG